MFLYLFLITAPFLFILHLYEKYASLPSSIPGPFLAKFTDLWRFLSVYRRSPEIEQCALHVEHRGTSDLVRLGPNNVSVCGPGYVSQIYDISKKLPKSDFYATFQNIVNGRRAASLVAVTDEGAHAKMKRLVANAYALSTLVEFEPLVDSTTEVFLDVLDQRFTNTSTKSKAMDLGQYLQFYAFDVMGELTFSKRLGFLESGEDVNGIMASINDNFEYFSLIGQMPWLDELLGKNPIYVQYFRKNVSSPILKFAQTLLRERLRQLESGEPSEQESAIGKPDFLARFLQAKTQVQSQGQKEGEEETTPMTDGLLLSFLFGNINAGSDTIATTLRAVFFYLLTHAEALAKLKHELNTAIESGNLTLPTPTWHETQSDHLVYLRSVVKEALRLWPALSLPLERVVVDKAGLPLRPPPSSSSGSANQDVTVLPQGTVVGINPYVLHRDPRIFDPNFASPSADTNVEAFDPDRWLPPTTNSDSHKALKNSRGNTEAQLKTMEHSIFTFGGGKRSCLGKNIAMMELLKVVPALLLKFPDMRLVDSKKFKSTNAWVLAQTGLLVELTKS